MDDMDFVQDINEQHRVDALNDHKRGREPDDNPGIDCCDCNEEIPIERRRAKPGCRRCISCQETSELLTHWGVT
jgi:phage/conjugal plasmid C-4 type zinc finger TraR family protein